MRPIRIGILLFDDVEVLDFAGPYEVLSTARRNGAAGFEVFTLSQTQEVRCRGGLRVLTDALLDQKPHCDVLVVPGGPGAREEGSDEDPLIETIRRSAGHSVVAGVCTGAFLMARAGLLAGRRATTHSARLEDLRVMAPTANVTSDKVIDEGQVITSGGVSSGIDMALHLVERYLGSEARADAAERLDGPWR